MLYRAFLMATTVGVVAGYSARCQIINTVAGSGQAGYTGDQGMATKAQLNAPWGIATDNTGNLYIADRNNNSIRKISTAGIITTIGGNGTPGYSGDGEVATNAKLNNPTGVAIDALGNVYIADKDNHCVRKIAPSGIITTMAGNGSAGYTGNGGPAFLAQLNNPRGIAIDAENNIYIADAGNHVVRKIDASGLITTIAGNGSAGYNGDGGTATTAQLHGPYHIAIDNAENIFIADVDNARIRKVSPDGTISTVAGNGITGYSGDGGRATEASLQEPISIASDKAGNLYIADAWNARIRRINGSGVIETVAGNGIPGYAGDGGDATAAQLNNPYGIAIKDNTLFISDNGNNRIRLINTLHSGNAIPPRRSILAYPNPSHGELTIQVNSPNGSIVNLELIGINGERYPTFTSVANWPTLVRTNVPAGMYLLTGFSTEGPLLPVALIIQ